VTEKHMLR